MPLRSPEYWRERAEEARTAASNMRMSDARDIVDYWMARTKKALAAAAHMRNNANRLTMLEIAAQYEALARHSASQTQYEKRVATDDKRTP